MAKAGRPRDPKSRARSPEYTRFSGFVRKSLVKRLKIHAIRTDKDMSSILEVAVEEYLKKHRA